MISFPLDTHPEVGFLGCMVALFVIFGESFHTIFHSIGGTNLHSHQLHKSVQGIPVFLEWSRGEGCWACNGVCSWLATRGSGGHGSYWLPRLVGLPPILCWVWWHWDKGPLQAAQLRPQTEGLLSDVQSVIPSRSMGVLLSVHWIGPWLGRTGPGQWLR